MAGHNNGCAFLMNIIAELLKINKASDFGIVFLTWLKMENDSTEKSHVELAKLFRKHPITFGKQISRLIDQKLLVVEKKQTSRILALSDSVRNSLYNYSNYIITTKNNNTNDNIISIPENKIKDSKISAISDILCRKYIQCDIFYIKELLYSRSKEEWYARLREESLGQAILKFLKSAHLEKKFPMAPHLEFDEFPYQIENTLQQIFNNRPFEERTFGGPTDSEIANKLHQKNHDAMVHKSMESKLIDCNLEYEYFQESDAIGQFGKIEAKLIKVRPYGEKRPIGNLHLELFNGTKVYATITKDIFFQLKEEITGFVGERVEVRGKIVYNKFYDENIIQSVKAYSPILLKTTPTIKPGHQKYRSQPLDTKLSINNDDDDDSPF